jgi:predicted ATP-grasp superfamily ATP-dependent carboligase
MEKSSNSILVIGFNTRPLAYSLSQIGFEVYVVDFFGDIDIYPYIKDSIIITEELEAGYDFLKDKYSTYLTSFAFKLLNRNPSIQYVLISSGLDDAYDQREKLFEELHKINPELVSLNNEIRIIRDSRNTYRIHELLKNWGYPYPSTYSYDPKITYDDLQYPFIFKKRTSSGGLNVFKINSPDSFNFTLKLTEIQDPDLSDWQIQEYIDGIPVSCTIISNGENSELVSVNRQIIGEKFCNPPKEFMYCGNIVPANLLPSDEKIIAEISIRLSNELNLKGINGIDFVLRNHEPFFMEINPRIPGSIRASESSMNLNLLDLHIQSFDPDRWDYIKMKLKSVKRNKYSTKLIYFAPTKISRETIKRINVLPYIHDKSKPNVNLKKNDPVCSVLFTAPSFAESYFEALKIVEKMNDLIQKNEQ